MKANNENHADLFLNDVSCRKRVWVLATLSDEDAMGPGGIVPPAVQFHLAQCPSCRRVADRILSTVGSLGALSRLQPPVGLAERADAQLAAAFGRGAVPTGRTPEPATDDFEEYGTASHESRRLRWLAVAAALIAAVTWAGSDLFHVEQQRTIERIPAGRGDRPDHADPRRSVPTNAAEALAEKRLHGESFRLCPDGPLDADGLPMDADCVLRAFSVVPRAPDALVRPVVPATQPPPEAKAIKTPGR